jgi:hypothetical protein
MGDTFRNLHFGHKVFRAILSSQNYGQNLFQKLLINIYFIIIGSKDSWIRYTTSYSLTYFLTVTEFRLKLQPKLIHNIDYDETFTVYLSFDLWHKNLHMYVHMQVSKRMCFLLERKRLREVGQSFPQSPVRQLGKNLGSKFVVEKIVM